MPIYDFKCAKCGHRFDRLCPISARSQAACPKCGGEAVRVYEGKWAMGPRSVAKAGGCACGGSCAGCAGCGKS